jgi:hypothetical protein
MADKKVFKIGNKVAIYLEPPDLRHPKGKRGFSKTYIWVERGDFYGGPARPKSSPNSKGSEGKRKKRKATKPQPPEDYLILGFDTEFVSPKRMTPKEIREGIDNKIVGTGKNQLVSYQFACIGPSGERWSGIACTDLSQGKDDRLGLGEFLIFALGSGLRSGAIKSIPKNIYLAGHFTRADFTAFSDFKSLTQVLSNIRGTFATTESPLFIEVDFPKGDPVELKLYTRDTMLLTPQSSKSLSAVGDLVGLPKIKLDPDPEKEQLLKEQMDVVRRTNWSLFREYAIRDAVVCAEYLKRISDKQIDLTGVKRVTPTLTGIGVKLLLKIWDERGRNAHLEILGKEEIKERTYSKRLGYYVTKSVNVLLEEVHWFQKFAIECYHGGRGEQFWFGPSYEADWSDYDLSSAYPTAMSLIGYPDWRKVYTSYNVDDYQPEILGVACVDFAFPHSVRYPVLPVRTDNGIIFPRTGRSYCASPEIALAKSLGATLSIRFGIIVPTNNDDPVFLPFIKRALDERAKSPKGTLESNFWKEIANSLYGKTAQGLHRKRVFDMRDRSMKELPESEITNPYFAAFITSFVRATMGEIMNALPDTSMVFSCTTDGFLTDATNLDIEKATRGPLSRIYSRQRKLLADDESVLEIKHRAKRLLGWRARGQATITAALPMKPGDKPPPMPLAKGGIHLVDHYDGDEMQNKAILDLFWNRTSKSFFPVHSLAGVRNVVELDIDSVPVVRTRKLNMEYDWKRRPYDVKDSAQFKHIAFSTIPWDHYDQFRTVRDVNESDKTPVIKSVRDLNVFVSSIETTISLSKEKRKAARKTDKAINIMMKWMSVIWCHDRQLLGSIPSTHTARNFAEDLTKCGCPCKRSDIENGWKRKFKSLERNSIPTTKQTIDAFNKLKEIYPAINPSDFLTSPETTDWLTFHEGGDYCPFLERLA